MTWASPILMRRQILLLALMALMLTNVVPTGWMPAKDNAGHFVVRICSQGLPEAEKVRIEALAQARMDHAMHSADRDSDGEHQAISDPCPYGVMANAFAVPPSPMPLSEPVDIVAVDLPLFSSNVGIGTGLAAPPPPSTGPPAFS